MGLDVTPNRLNALVFPDPRLTYAAAFSAASSTSNAGADALTQAGPLPGIFEAQGVSSMVLESVGTRSANQQLEILTIRAGWPEADGAAFVWRPSLSSGSYYGWDPPYSISDFEIVDYSTVASQWARAHAIAGRAGRVHVAVEKAGQKVVVWTRSAAGVWSDVEVYDKGAAFTNGARPTLVALPSGRLLCFFWRELTNAVNIRMHYSDDDGATWTKGQPSCLRAALSTASMTPKRLRAAYLNNQICLIAHLQGSTYDELHQYASNDGGATFAEVASLDDLSRGVPDVIAANGRLYVAYLKATGGTPAVSPYVIALGSAYEGIDSAEENNATFSADPAKWGTLSGGYIATGECALVADDDGSLWFFGRDEDGSATWEIIASRSIDGGDIWDSPGNNHASNHAYANPLWYGHDATTYPRYLTVCRQGGRLAMFHQVKTTAGVFDDSLFCAYLGGYTTINLPVQSAVADPAIDSMVTWENTWLSYGRPDAISSVYTRVSGGAGATISYGVDGMKLLHAGAGDADRWSTTLTNSLSSGAIGTLQVKVPTSGPAYATLTISDGAVSYSVRVEVTATGIAFKDVEAGTTIASVVTAAGASGVQILFAVRRTGALIIPCAAWYRVLSSSSAARSWTLIGSTSTLTAGVVAQAVFHWGTLAGSATTDARFKQAHATSSTYVGSHLAPAPDNYGDLLGKTYATTPVPVTDGLSLFAVDGPTYRNETWEESTRYEHGIENAHLEVEPSPRKGWRSTTTTQHDIVWTIGASNADVHAWLEGLCGLYLGGINWRTGSFWGRNSAGTWVKLCDIDAADGATSLKYARAGAIVQPVTGGTAASRFLVANTLAGSTMSLDASTRRRILTNGSGVWPGTTGTTQPARIALTGALAADPASGTTGEIWSKDVCLLLPEGATNYSAFKLRIDSQDTVDGYFTLQKFLFGPASILRYGPGRGIGVDFGYELSEGRSGVRAARSLIPARRFVEVDHGDGVPARSIYSVNSGGSDLITPNFIRAYSGSGPIIATPAAVLHTLMGLLGYLDGAVTPIVYVEGFPVGGTSAAITLTNRENFFYGRIVSESYGRDAVLGHEWFSEMARGRRFRVEEEV